MTAPHPQEIADMAYARHSAAAEQLLTAVAQNKWVGTNPTVQVEAAKVAALLALAAAIRASGSR
jgi:hypothetical protein